MHHKLLYLLTLLTTVITLGCSSSDDIASRLKKAASEHRPLYGHQDDLMYGHSWNASKDGDTTLLRSDVKSVCGHFPAILGLDLGGIELGDKFNLDSNDFNLQRLAAIKHYERGGLVTVSWHVRNPPTGGDAWDVPQMNAVAAVLPRGEKHEMYMTWLERAADWLESLKTADGKQVPVIWRPYHEHSGSWFWWGKNLCSADEYNALWKMTHDYFTNERGLTRLLWAISPNTIDEDFEKWVDRYPGDDFVDVIGFDCYASDDKEKFLIDMRSGLSSLTKMCQEHSKILAVTETGYESIPDSSWWTEVLSPAIAGFPASYILTWRNASDKPLHYYAPFEGEPSAENFNEWINKDNITLINQ